jgi:hypothetical protein
LIAGGFGSEALDSTLTNPTIYAQATVTGGAGMVAGVAIDAMGLGAAGGMLAVGGVFVAMGAYLTDVFLVDHKTLVYPVMGPLKSAYIFDPRRNSFDRVGDLRRARMGHNAVVLPSGSVLMAGGLGEQGVVRVPEFFGVGGDNEFVEPGHLAWSDPYNADHWRVGATATQIGPGLNVLIAGGLIETRSGAQVELSLARGSARYEWGFWSGRTDGLRVPRFGHTATQVGAMTYFIGGVGREGPVKPVEKYDRDARQWTTEGELRTARFAHATVEVDDSTIVVVGGKSTGTRLATAELYDVRTGRTETLPMTMDRLSPCATRLNNGRVLVTGGTTTGPPLGNQATIQTARRSELLTVP